jgi:hypothetical protein
LVAELPPREPGAGTRTAAISFWRSVLIENGNQGTVDVEEAEIGATLSVQGRIATLVGNVLGQ